MTLARLAMIAGLLLSAGGCRCGDDRPYTPFGVASAVEAASPAPEASSADSADAEAPKPAFVGKAAIVSPARATRWQLGGRELSAPPSRVFERGLSADFDQDGSEEAVTWTAPSGTGDARGELWLHPSAGAPKRLISMPGFVPAGAGCTHTADLRQTGPQTVTLDIAATCGGTQLARTPKRALVVLAPLSERPQIIALRVAEPAPDEKLALAVDSTDRDGDGRDDVRWTLSVSRQGSQRSASASLIWFDRAAGVSRDASEPRASLERAASIALGRAKGKKTSESVPESVESVRRLMSTLCAEGGVPRVFDGDGGALSCGKLGVVVDRLALAETQAAATRGQWLDAVGAVTRDGWYFGRASEKTAKQLAQLIERGTAKVEPRSALTLEARPVARGDAPRFSPLSFDSGGKLNVQTAAGVVTVGSDGREIPLVEGGAAPAAWPLEVRSAADARWIGVAHACDRNETLLTVTGGDSQPIVSSLLAPRPGACRGGAVPKSSPPSPLAWKPNGLEAIVGGAWVGPKTSVAEAVLRPHPPGSPRSPDGRLLVVPTPLGLFVDGAAKPEIWRIAQPEWTSLSDCTVANGAAAAACVSGGRALLWLRP